MLENSAGPETLQLRPAFPPVSDAEWEAVIQKDLKLSDCGNNLIWNTEEGIAVKPYYRRGDLEKFGHLRDLSPGEFPYLRGSGTSWQETQNWIPPLGAVRADHLHEAGATAVQELGFALAEAVENLDAATASGKTVEEAGSATIFVFAVGSNYFFEIAKLRAARLLWSTAMSEFASEGSRPAIAHFHVRTARANKSLLDPFTNLLRVTTEALSAVIGGCDSLSVEAFGFDSHLATNVQRILREEAHLGRVADPAGGSYYIESLTEALAREAWKIFQTVEAVGGWSPAIKSGIIDQALADSFAAKAKEIASRRRTMVGVNNYPDLHEETQIGTEPDPLPHNRFAQHRLAEPFEAIRERTVRHAHSTGRVPKILLLKRGDLKMKAARANFCLNFFGCGGFDVVGSDNYRDTDADLIVLCSSDAEYLPLAREVCAHARIPVLVAGNPKEQHRELEAAGVQSFVHILSNAVETITRLQDQLGMDPLVKE